MFSEQVYSTFSEFLTALVVNLQNNQKSGGSIRDIKTLSVGSLVAPPQYPSLIITPTHEKILHQYTGKTIDVERGIQFEVTTLKPTIEASHGQCLGLINNLKILLSHKSNESFWRLKTGPHRQDLVINAEVDSIKPLEPVEIPNMGTFYKTFLKFKFQCKTRLSLDVERVQNLDLGTSTNIKEIGKITSELLEQYKTSLLSDIKTFKHGSLDPVGKEFPQILSYVASSEPEDRFVGVDSFNTDITIAAYINLFNNSRGVFQTLDTLEKIRNIISINSSLLSRCYNMDMGETTFTVDNQEKNNFFIGQFDFNVQSYERLN